MRFSFYEKPGWFFRWESPRWRIEPEPGFEEGGRIAVYTTRDGKVQVFKLHRYHSKYGEGWVPVDLTGFWIKREEAWAGAPIGAFLRELDTIRARLLPKVKQLPDKTFDSQTQKYCSCLFYQPKMGCLVHSPECKCDSSELLSFGCRCGGI